MTHAPETVQPVREARAAGNAFVQTRAFEILARTGFVARGLVYGIIGLLAFELAVGHGGKLASQKGAMQAIKHQPFGTVLLTLVAIGLGGYAIWRLFRAILGHGPEGADRGIERLGALGSGIVYGAVLHHRDHLAHGLRVEQLLRAPSKRQEMCSAGRQVTGSSGSRGL